VLRVRITPTTQDPCCASVRPAFNDVRSRLGEDPSSGEVGTAMEASDVSASTSGQVNRGRRRRAREHRPPARRHRRGALGMLHHVGKGTVLEQGLEILEPPAVARARGLCAVARRRGRHGDVPAEHLSSTAHRARGAPPVPEASSDLPSTGELETRLQTISRRSEAARTGDLITHLALYPD